MNGDAWQPTAPLTNLRLRAKVIAEIRGFFAERGVLEVDTPLLSHGTVTDPFIQSMGAEFKAEGAKDGRRLYLQTSPEFAMKRLLSAGSGPIYQICKAFRNGEAGRLHNPEFTMLEWYRPGFDHHALMTEMDGLLQAVLKALPAERLTYAAVFDQWLGIDPHTATIAELAACAQGHRLGVSHELAASFDADTWLQLLMSHVIEPQLGQGQPTFLYDFPASQAALARVDAGPPAVAQRFEVYIEGIELANGFYELADAIEQERRFERDLQRRKQLGTEQVPIDRHLLAALSHGFPDCAGVALGIDRLIMLAANALAITEVIAFPIDRA